MANLYRIGENGRPHRGAPPLLIALVISAYPALAVAGGMFVPLHGVRPLGRGGAFVAGADDLNAIWYNPAGLAQLNGNQFLIDATLVDQILDYTRVDSGGVTEPPVHDSGTPLPIPQIAVSHNFIEDRFTGGLLLTAPYTSFPSFPANGPQRYSLVNLSGTLLLEMEAAVGVKL